MRYVLDTTAVSALMKGDASTVARLAKAQKSEVGIPQPVLAELSYGIARLPKSKKRESLSRALQLIADEIPRADWTDSVSDTFGTLKAALEHEGTKIDDFDCAIAAHALAARATLVTSNVGHMSRVDGLRVEDWSAT